MNIETVWQQYRHQLKAFLLKNMADPVDVEDVLQEVLLKSYEKIGTIRETKKVKSWLFQIARNVMVDFYRAKAKANEVSFDEMLFMAPAHQLEIEQQLALCITPFINLLPSDAGKLLTAIDIQGQSQKAYALEQGLNYSTLKSKVQKARTLLLAQFERCCELTLDHQGRVLSFEEKKSHCERC